MKREYFGTDGVRGTYGGPVMNETFAARLGEAAGRWIAKSGKTEVLIGRDTRFSGEGLARALACGFAHAGARPISLGVLPTPAVARAVKVQGAGLGVVITASHNPAEDNGIKIFGSDGAKLSDEDEAQIEALLPERSVAVGNWPGAERTLDGAAAAYIAAVKDLLPANSLAGWRIVLDTANGATCVTSASVLRGLGAEIIALGDRPDGRNINAGVGSEHPEQLADLVTSSGARLGIAHDGDGDRCILCDEQGAVLDGDEVMTILATRALSRGNLAARTLVVTHYSNLGVDAAIKLAGGRVIRTGNGDRYVAQSMVAAGATLGGEASGHIIFSEVSPAGDGLVAALKVIEVMLATGQPLSELRRVLKKFPQRSRALKVREKRPIETLPALQSAMRAVEAELGAEGRILVRYSGTESKLRLLVEGAEVAHVQVCLERLEAGARADLAILEA